MASRRMISSDIWRDEFIGTLDLFGRVLWVGLIATCADDQGRLLNNPRLIRSDVFPLDDFTTALIDETIQRFAGAGRITIYESEGKSLVQINNWWEYQTPSWASASKYPPPPGWIDREKYHTVGNKIAIRNWDRKGGFQNLPSELHSQLPSALNDVKDEVKGDVKDETQAAVEGSGGGGLADEFNGLAPEVKVFLYQMIRTFSEKFGNQAQIDKIVKLRGLHGEPKTLEAMEWYAVKGVSLGEAINRAEHSLPTWGQGMKKSNGNGNGHIPAEQSEEQNAQIRKELGLTW